MSTSSTSPVAFPAPIPVVTIFVRHSAHCKYRDDEFSRRCRCRKHLRWTQNGKQHRRQAGTRSWEEAERIKRSLESQLSGVAPTSAGSGAIDLKDAIDQFIERKDTEDVTEDRLGRYRRELDRLREYCEKNRVYTVQAMSDISDDLLEKFCGTWKELYPSTQTRSSVRDRLRSFLRYCHDKQWIARVPKLPKIKMTEPPTMPLSENEYTALLNAVPKTFTDPERQSHVRALLQLMRWSGLAIGDALTLEKSEIERDVKKRIYRVVTSRQKTGVHVSVPLPPSVAEELIAISKPNPRYVFDSQSDDLSSEVITKSWRKYFIAPVFKEANIGKGGNMVSHRLRDTFACDLLVKGVPVGEVSKLLGHKSVKLTEEHYEKWIKGRQDRLDKLVMGTW